MRPRMKEFEALGASVVGIACQSPRWARRSLERDPWPYPLLLDVDRKVVKAYGTYQLLGFDGVHLARMSVYVIDGEGVIRWIYRSRTQWDVPAVDLLLDAVRKISPPGPPGR